MAKRVIAIFVTVTSASLAVLYWGDPCSYGWICAAAGWVDKCFEE